MRSMEDRPLVSIITVSYKVEKIIEQAILRV